MYAPTLDKKQHAQPILGEVEVDSSPVFTPPVVSTPENAAHRFKYDFVSERILEVNKELRAQENPRSLLESGDLYLLRGNYRKAIKQYERALELDPSLVQAIQKIIAAYISHAEFNEADKYYQKLYKTYKEDFEFLHSYAVFKAFIYINPTNTDEAVELLEKAIEKNPTSFEAINSYGMVLLNFKNKPIESRVYFEKAHKINPKYIHALNNMGVSYLREENYDEAERIFKEVVKQEPDIYPLGYQNLTSLYIRVEKYTEALATLEGAKERGVKLENTIEHKKGWLLIQLAHFADAVKWYSEKVESEPKNDLLYNNLGVCYKALGDYENAERCFRKAVELFRARSKALKFILIDHLKSLYNLGRVAVDQRDLPLLQEIYEEILSIHPTDAYGIYLKASKFTLEYNYKEAKLLYEEALERDPDIVEIYPDYSFILTSIEKNQPEAIKVLTGAIKQGYRTVNIDNNLAYAYIQDDKLREAEKVISQYRVNQLPPMLLPTKGLLEFRKGNLELGNKYYEMAMKALKESSKIRKILKQIHLYEQARYLGRSGEKEPALSAIREALSLPNSYVSDDLEVLKKELS